MVHLALEVDGDGVHPAAWRRAAHTPDQLLRPARWRTVGQAAENAGFALVTLDDSMLPPDRGAGPVGRIGAMERAAFVAASTTLLGIAPTVSTSYAEPFHTSSQLASLDHISTGRAGWVVATSPEPEAARAWGRPLVPDAAAHRREAGDSVQVARQLWDSWDDDAVIRDVATSRYLDRERLHYIDFTGHSFAVKGPAIVPRPPQGQVVVFAPAGLLPDEQVDVTLSTEPRRADTPLTFVELEVALDVPGATAAERVDDLARHAPWPDRGRRRYLGGPDGLVRLLSDLGGHVDGVRLHPLVLDEDLGVLSRLVLPALSVARVIRRAVPGASLRTTLGLPRPANRYQPHTTPAPAPAGVPTGEAR